jgi:hypothetical protein
MNEFDEIEMQEIKEQLKQCIGEQGHLARRLTGAMFLLGQTSICLDNSEGEYDDLLDRLNDFIYNAS